LKNVQRLIEQTFNFQEFSLHKIERHECKLCFSLHALLRGYELGEKQTSRENFLRAYILRFQVKSRIKGENLEVPLRHMSFNFEKLARIFLERAFLRTSLSSSLLPFASSLHLTPRI
jgi:cell fate regulator YaaT (PSP1 superfamily)